MQVLFFVLFVVSSSYGARTIALDLDSFRNLFNGRSKYAQLLQLAAKRDSAGYAMPNTYERFLAAHPDMIVYGKLPTTTTTTTTPEPTTEEATTTAGPDWEAICAEPDQDLATNFNFNRGKWGVSKTMFAGQRTTLTRVNVKGRPATSQYNGAAFFARKYCGGDFLAKLADGTITVDVMDKVATYQNVQGYYKDDGGNTAYVVQWSNTAVSGNEGNAKKDKLYIKLIGLEDVNWGNKDMKECIASRMIVGHMDYSEEDHTPCLAWQRTVGN